MPGVVFGAGDIEMGKRPCPGHPTVRWKKRLVMVMMMMVMMMIVIIIVIIMSYVLLEMGISQSLQKAADIATKTE